MKSNDPEDKALIRKITRADRKIYLEMAHDFYHSEAVLHPVPDEYLVRSFDEMMRSEEYLTGLIFEYENRIAGYALLNRSWSQEAGGMAVWIEEIYVLDQYRSRGLGHELFAAIEKFAPAVRYRLEIEPDNARAEKLYRSMGFEPMGYLSMVRENPR